MAVMFTDLFVVAMCDRSQRYSFMTKNKSQLCNLSPYYFLFSFFFKIFVKKSGKCLHESKNDYIFAMISEMKCKNKEDLK
jgi:hypothetical protein